MIKRTHDNPYANKTQPSGNRFLEKSKIQDLNQGRNRKLWTTELQHKIGKTMIKNFKKQKPRVD